MKVLGVSKVIAIIPARGGSKGIPKKNIIKVAGYPLIVWSILQAKKAKEIESVWVTSDDDQILDIAQHHGALVIKRPEDISGDDASSESAWAHALEHIKKNNCDPDIVVAMQATSPVREPIDLSMAISKFKAEKLDSMLSVCLLEDYFIWNKNDSGYAPINYDLNNRKRRQNIEPKYLENGSFYIFKPKILTELGNRLGGKIGIYEMAKHKSFQIDSVEDLRLCEAILDKYNIKCHIA